MKIKCPTCDETLKVEVESLDALDFTKVDCPVCRGNLILFKGKVYDLAQKSVNDLFTLGFFKDAYTNNKAMDLFNERSSIELDIVGHPKEGTLRYKAYEHGHSSGLQETWGWMQDLVDLIK